MPTQQTLLAFALVSAGIVLVPSLATADGSHSQDSGKCRLRPFPELLSAPLAIVSRGSAEAVVVLVDLDELAEHWTLLDDERELVADKRGPTRLGFPLILKYLVGALRPRHRCDAPGTSKAVRGRRSPGSRASTHRWSSWPPPSHRRSGAVARRRR